MVGVLLLSSLRLTNVRIVLLILAMEDVAYTRDAGQMRYIVRRRGCTQCSMQHIPPLLLAIEDAAYSSSPPCNVGCGILFLSSSCDGGGNLLLTLHHVQDDEEDDAYLIVRRRGGLGDVLLLSSLQWSCSTHCSPY